MFLIVWKYAGFYMLILLVGPAGHPVRGLRGRRDRRRDALADAPRRVTLPLLRPSLALALILCITGSLLAFDQFYILTKGGPDNTTVTVVQLIYREAFQRQNLGTAAALSIIVLAVLLVINAVQFRGLRSAEQRLGAAMRADARRTHAVLRPDRRAWRSSSCSRSSGARSPRSAASPGPPRRAGSGFGNYATLFTYGSGLGTYLCNSVIVSRPDGRRDAGRVGLRRLCVRPVHASRAGTRCSC